MHGMRVFVVYFCASDPTSFCIIYISDVVRAAEKARLIRTLVNNDPMKSH